MRSFAEVSDRSIQFEQPWLPDQAVHVIKQGGIGIHNAVLFQHAIVLMGVAK